MTYKPVPFPPYDRPATREAERAVAARFVEVFADIRTQVADALRSPVAKRFRLRKAGEDDADRRAEEIVAGLDLSELANQADGVAEDVAPVVADVVKASARVGLGTDDESGFVNRVNERATKAVVDKLAPEIAGLPDTTRQMLRQTIATALEGGMTLDDIADRIEDAYALSPDRAATIAATEVARANSEGSLASYKSVAAGGGAVRKGWDAEPGCCAICEGNDAGGPIALDQPFPSGHLTPPGHPGCRCCILPFVDEEATKMAKAFSCQDIMTTGSPWAKPADYQPPPYDGPEAITANWHREAVRLQELHEGLSNLVKALKDTNAELRKLGSSPSVEVEQEAEAALKRLEAHMAEPLPLPWEAAAALIDAEPAGNA